MPSGAAASREMTGERVARRWTVSSAVPGPVGRRSAAGDTRPAVLQRGYRVSATLGKRAPWPGAGIDPLGFCEASTARHFKNGSSRVLKAVFTLQPISAPSYLGKKET